MRVVSIKPKRIYGKLEEDREKRDREKNEDIKGAFLYQRGRDELRAEKSPPKLFQLHYQIPKAKLIKQTRPSNHRKRGRGAQNPKGKNSFRN